MNHRADLDRLRAFELPDRVPLTRGDTVTLEPVQWLWHGFLPQGMLTIMGGSPGCGKTTIALSMASTVTTSGQWPDGTQAGPPGDVIVWSGEDAPTVLAARLRASGADMTRVHFIDPGTEGEPFDPGRDMPLLEASIESLPTPRLLLLDPIVSAVAGDSHKGAEVRRALQPIVTLAHRLGCAVLGITHFSKGTGGRDPVERVTGSIAFAALARLVLVAAKSSPDTDDNTNDERRVFMRAKSNIGPDDGGFAYELERVEVAPGVEGQRVRWIEPLEGTARELLAEAETTDDDADRGDAADWLRDLLRAGPVAVPDIKRLAAQSGLPWRTVQRARHRVGAEFKRTGFGKPALWSLKASAASVAPRVAPLAPHTETGAIGANERVSVTIEAPTDDVERF